MEDTLNSLHQHAETFRNALKSNDQDQFALVTRDGLHREIRDLQLQMDQTKTMMNMGRIGMFLHGIDELEGALIAVAVPKPKVSEAMALIWGSVRFLIKTTELTDKAFDNVLDAYESLGSNLLDLSRYTRFYLEFPDSQQCLIRTYEDIQKFHLIAYELFSLRKKLWQRLHKSIWKDLRYTLEHIAGSLRSHADFIKIQGAGLRDTSLSPDSGVYPLDLTEDFLVYRRELSRSLKNFEKSEVERKEAQKNRVTAWISAPSKNEDLHAAFQKARVSGTGRWLFRSYRSVSDWMQGGTKGEITKYELSESSIWLHGKRGFGKTMLASLVVDELHKLKNTESAVQVPADSKVYYFYCQEDDGELGTYLSILRGILHQMVDQERYILPFCEDKMSYEGPGRPPDAAAAESLIKLFFAYSRRQYVVIDGLDECEPNEVSPTAKFFKSQVDNCDAVALGQLRVLLVSQPMPEMEADMPQDHASIPLRSTDNRDDIRAYVKKRVAEFSQLNEQHIDFNLTPADEQQIESAVCRQSEDMFLYAHLAMEHLLQQQSKGDLLRCASQEMLPKELSMLYKTLLRSVKARILQKFGDKKPWKTSKLLLGWLVGAKRPLKWHELQSILSFNPETRTVDLDSHMLRHHVRNYLGSLVHILDGGHIRLIHATARTHVFRYHDISEEKIQCKLAILCLQYLSLPCFINGFDQNKRSEQALEGWFSFQDYACSQWHSHINTVILNCREIFFSKGSRERALIGDFSSAMEVFIRTHRMDMTVASHPELKRDHIDEFKAHRCFSDLLFLWNHIYTHQKGTFEERNNVGISQIDTALLENRKELEQLSPKQFAVHRDTVEDYYGPNLFKCGRTLCNLFWVGFDNEKARQRHEQRHDRPFPCPHSCSSAPNVFAAFATFKELERHLRNHHGVSDGPSPFKALSRRQTKPLFKCSICNQEFTRRANMESHVKTHFGIKPHSCTTCGKAFTRINDCRRHEKIHSRRGGR